MCVHVCVCVRVRARVCLRMCMSVLIMMLWRMSMVHVHGDAVVRVKIHPSYCDCKVYWIHVRRNAGCETTPVLAGASRGCGVAWRIGCLIAGGLGYGAEASSPAAEQRRDLEYCSCSLSLPPTPHHRQGRQCCAAPACLQETARYIAEVSRECKLEVDPDTYVESFRPFLMDIMYSWSKGASFAEICGITGGWAAGRGGG